MLLLPLLLPLLFLIVGAAGGQRELCRAAKTMTLLSRSVVAFNFVVAAAAAGAGAVADVFVVIFCCVACL